MSDSENPWTAECQASLSIIFWSLLKFMFTKLVMPSNHFILSPLSLPTLSFPASRCFSMSWFYALGGQSIAALGSVLLMNFQSWFPLGLTGLISPVVQGTFKKLLQHHSLKASIICCSALFMVQPSHLYMTTRKTIVWLYGPLSAKWCLCFAINCSFVAAFLPNSRCLLIFWLQSLSTVILETKKTKSVIVSTFICP